MKSWDLTNIKEKMSKLFIYTVCYEIQTDILRQLLTKEHTRMEGISGASSLKHKV